MEDKVFLERPSIVRENDAIDFINEFKQYKSDTDGDGGLDRYLDNYKEWLKKLENHRNTVPSEEKVPAETYFLVRKSDKRIIGMCNIRFALNKKLIELNAWHIGYCIRPTERRKGYAKRMLYLALEECRKHNIKEVIIGCDKDNIGSSKTITSFSSKLIKEYMDTKYYNCIQQQFSIDVDKAIEHYKELNNFEK